MPSRFTKCARADSLSGLTPDVSMKSSTITVATQPYPGAIRKPKALATEPAAAMRSICVRRPLWSASQPQAYGPKIRVALCIEASVPMASVL